MDINFQDKIDQYLLHPETMSEAEKAQFLKDVEQDKKKKAQFEFTANLRSVIKSREEKLKMIKQMQKQYDQQELSTGGATDIRVAATSEAQTIGEVPNKPSHRRNWLYWASGIAAVVAIGFFVIQPYMMVEDTNNEVIRNTGNGLFDRTNNNSDSLTIDTLSDDTLSPNFIQKL